MFAFSLLVVSASAFELLDPLWLRYPRVSDESRLIEYRGRISSARIVGTADHPQLRALASELELGLEGLLGQSVPVACCDPSVPSPGLATTKELIVSVTSVEAKPELGAEGFRIGRTGSGAVLVESATNSGALYGTFRLLAAMQFQEAIPDDFTSAPAMDLRVWNLWDNLNGEIERGYAGRSLIWPMALFSDEGRPPRNQVFLRPCDSTDPWQKWKSETLLDTGEPSTIVNVANGECLPSRPAENPMMTTSDLSACTKWMYNSNRTIRAEDTGHCMDVQDGEGPNIDVSHCKHLETNRNPDALHDVRKQMFQYHNETQQIRTMDEIFSPLEQGQCLSLETMWPAPPGLDPYNANGPGAYRTRFAHMMRLLKSSGLNGISLLNVNACGDNVALLKSESLRNISRNLGPILEAWGITPYFAVCYAAPFIMANISSSPANPAAETWWADKAREIRDLLPTFGGFIVNADSEGNQGPQDFNTTEADGANLLARAVKPIGGVVIWRAFVYDGDTEIGHEDRARQAYNVFKPIDGGFDDNVVVQIKNGPMDFQVREPVSPLLAGGLTRTNVMMEVQAAQEYTGQQIHVVGLTTQWKSYLDFDTDLQGTTVASILTGKANGGRGKGMACVSNLGNWANLTGHLFAASNTYGCGRLSWDPTLTAADIHHEWAAMTFATPTSTGREREGVLRTVASILDRSWGAFEGYTSPLGIGFMCAACGESVSGCVSKVGSGNSGPGGIECPFSWDKDELQRTDGSWGHPFGLENGHQSSHYLLDPCTNWRNQNATSDAIGCDRTEQAGTGYTAQYHPAVRDLLNDPSTCPMEQLLFFHNLPWTHRMGLANGSTVLLVDYIAAKSRAALNTVYQMAEDWNNLAGLVDSSRFKGVQQRLQQQCVDALSFNQVIIGYYMNISGRKPWPDSRDDDLALV